MLTKNDIKIIVNDIVNTIILIVEEEGEMQINMLDFIKDNFKLLLDGNLIKASREELLQVDLSIILFRFALIGFKFDILDSQNNRINLPIDNITDFKELLEKELIIYV